MCESIGHRPLWGRCPKSWVLSVDKGWMPLPTCPQRYCDPASLFLVADTQRWNLPCWTLGRWVGPSHLFSAPAHASAT